MSTSLIAARIEECASEPQESFSRLPRDFFTRDGIALAKDLLGKILVHHTRIGVIRGVITEVESYMGEEDKGSHTYGGRRTERTEPMYHIGGTSYVYLIYGMYSCMNIAAMTEGIPQAVLIRSVVPADEVSRQRMYELRLAARKVKNAEKKNQSPNKRNAEQAYKNLQKHLADGPGKMCIAMDITRADNDIDMVESDVFYVTEGLEVPMSCVKAGKRIGIDYAEEAADYLWRFYLE
ncbi:MAG: DNA-3-methyladenine glycosylase [Bacteroidales bacterium]|nr:DNA-3-methyladenine glycosylase [Lachnoclostridium sp.]MCM1384950.1 DNA-3-methyladenine glycosylase [Lachnoclostridium sp.]MCM1465838.1 DNA-3-methyladenine glycosylase [Bacteroidales bacterium]